MKFCNSHLTRNIFNLYMRRFFFSLVYLHQILHNYLFQNFPATGMQNGEETVRGLLVKMFLNRMVYFDHILHTYSF